MSTSAPEVTSPVTFPAPIAWLQRQVKTHVRPYHFAVAGLLGLITGIFGLVLVLMILTSTNFNVLGWME